MDKTDTMTGSITGRGDSSVLTLTGAEMVIRALKDQGRDAHLRLSRRGGAAFHL